MIKVKSKRYGPQCAKNPNAKAAQVRFESFGPTYTRADVITGPSHARARLLADKESRQVVSSSCSVNQYSFAHMHSYSNRRLQRRTGQANARLTIRVKAQASRCTEKGCAWTVMVNSTALSRRFRSQVAGLTGMSSAQRIFFSDQSLRRSVSCSRAPKSQPLIVQRQSEQRPALKPGQKADSSNNRGKNTVQGREDGEAEPDKSKPHSSFVRRRSLQSTACQAFVLRKGTRTRGGALTTG